MLRVLLLISVLTSGLALAQVELSSPERQALEQDQRRYQQLLEERAAQLRGIEAALGETAAQLRRRLTERDEVSAQLAQKRRERDEVLAQIEALTAERTDTEARIAELNARMSELEVRVQDLLVSLYKQRGRRTAAGLAQSRSFHDLRVRNHYLGLLAEQDAAVIREMDGVLTELDAERERLAQQIAQLEQAEAELAQAEAELRSSQARLAEIIEELNATQAGQMIQQEALLEEQTRLERSLGDVTNALEAEIARLREEERRAREEAARFAADRARQQELQRQADLARARADALATPLVANPGGFIRPFENAELLTRFGEGNNSYIAIRAPVPNAAVRAVQNGRVAAVTYMGANLGYMLALQHDDDFVTVYINLREPVVEPLQAVPQGTVLGYLGGGTLTRNDVLQFYARRGLSGNSPFIDPAPLLGW